MPSHAKFGPLAPESLCRQGEPNARTNRNSKTGTGPILLPGQVGLPRASLTAQITPEIDTRHAVSSTNDRIDRR